MHIGQMAHLLGLRVQIRDPSISRVRKCRSDDFIVSNPDNHQYASPTRHIEAFPDGLQANGVTFALPSIAFGYYREARTRARS
jgi:hypothetical protein